MRGVTRRPARWRMTVAWVAMGALVTGGFYLEARDDQERCEAGNAFRRQDLPEAFDLYSVFLGGELGASRDAIDDARARFAAQLDDLFPPRDCALWP